jgi:hypothetical protein
VLADNATKLAMCRELGFSVEADPGRCLVRTASDQLSFLAFFSEFLQ